MQSIIRRLMWNDRNATWDECTTIEELFDALYVAWSEHGERDDTSEFYARMMSELLEVAQ